MQSICEMRNFCAPICRARTSAMQSWREAVLALADLHDADFSAAKLIGTNLTGALFKVAFFWTLNLRMPICAVLF